MQTPKEAITNTVGYVKLKNFGMSKYVEFAGRSARYKQENATLDCEKRKGDADTTTTGLTDCL